MTDPLRRPRGRDRVSTPDAVPSPSPSPSPSTGAIRGLLGPVTGSLKIGRGRPEGDVQSLRVDWPQCKGHGLCAEVAPEIVQLDEWGFPLIERRTLAPEELPMARKATQVCPTLALKLVGPPPS